MKILFWGSAGIIVYTYAGYPGWLWLRSRWRKKPIQTADSHSSVSILMVVRNEDAVIERKIQNVESLQYPSGNKQIIVVSDGSRDRTNTLLSQWATDPGFQIIINPDSRGKAAGLNSGLEYATGEIVVFTDARQIIEPNAIEFLAENFADPKVGCVSGELMLGDPASGENSDGVGLYWQIEKKIRELESVSGSVVGATGALYAVRRNLLHPIPAETILDDVYIPMMVGKQGFRVIFEPRARAWDMPHQEADREFARKVRTLSGNYQLLQLAPWLLTRANPIRFEFISHKLLRLLVPFALLALLLAPLFIHEPVYHAALLLQMGFYGLSLLALAGMPSGPVTRASNAAFTFVLLNTAAIVAFANFVTRKRVVWVR